MMFPRSIRYICVETTPQLLLTMVKNHLFTSQNATEFIMLSNTHPQIIVLFLLLTDEF